MKGLLLALCLTLLPCWVSAQTVVFPNRGGTGTTTIPSAGQVLVGQPNGTYGPQATSSLGIGGLSTSSIDTEAKLEAILTDVTNVLTNNDSTSNLTEGSNLYYTVARVQSALTAGYNAVFGNATATNATTTNFAVTGSFNFLGTVITNIGSWFSGLFDSNFAAKSTSNLAEGSNLYFTTARARSAISASSGISYSTSTGAIGLDATGNWSGTFDGQEGSYYLSRANHTGSQAASTISDFTASARAVFSTTATGLSYNSSSGILSLAAGYSIPLSASTSEWATAYGWGNHATAGYLTAVSTSTVRGMLSAGAGLSYSAATGQFANTGVLSIGGLTGSVSTSSLGLPTFSNLADYLTLAAWYATTTDALDEGDTNLYFTNDRADARITAQKGEANGLATLDGAGKVPSSQLPNSIMEYQGTWDANANNPTLEDGTGNPGGVYRVSVAGSQDLGSGTISFVVGDYAIYNGSAWEKADTTDAVSSVNGLTGDVSLDTDDIAEAGNEYFTASRARSAISETVTGLDYSSGTGVISLTSGFTIPLTASTSEWATAYASTTALTPAYIRNLFSNTATGLTYSNGVTSLTAGYLIPLSASTTNWNGFYDTPSGRIAAGDALTWSGNTLHFDGGNTPGGVLGGTWASPTLDDASIASSTLNASNWAAGRLLQASTTASGGFAWVATSTLGISGGGSGNAAWTIGNGFIYNATTSDNVGIGSSTPYYKLAVNGDIYASNIRRGGDFFAQNFNDITGSSYVGLNASTVTVAPAGPGTVVLDAAAIRPDSNDGTALGSTTRAFSDLFLASGGVINWNNGDVTLVHSLNLLTLAGGDFSVSGLLSATTISSTSIGNTVNGLTVKGTPANNDMFVLMDSAASNVAKKLSWSNLLVGIGTWLQGITGYADGCVLTASSTATFGVAWGCTSGGSIFQYATTTPYYFARSRGEPVSVYNGIGYLAAAASSYSTIPFKQAIGLAGTNITESQLPYPTVVTSTSGTRTGFQGNVTISNVPAGNNYVMLTSVSQCSGVTLTGMTQFSNSCTGSFMSAYMLLGNHAGGDITYPITTGDLGGATIGYTVAIVGNATQSAPTELATYNAESSKAATTTLKYRVFTLMGDNTNTDVTSLVEPNTRIEQINPSSSGRAALFTAPAWQSASTTFAYSRNIRATLVQLSPAVVNNFPQGSVVLGGALDSLTGLTLRTKYYVSNTGTLSTASGTTLLPVGYPISSTTMMLLQLP